MSFDDLSRLENKFENIVNNNSVNDVFNYIDELDDVEADEMLDWLKDNNKSLYNRYMRSADIVDDFANSGINMGNIKSKAYDQQIKEITNARYKGVNLTTLITVIRTLGITIDEFFKSPLFDEENLDCD